MVISKRAMEFLIDKSRKEVVKNSKILAQAHDNLNKQNQKLQSLAVYRKDCQTGLLNRGLTGQISMADVRNQLAFVSKIDQAIVQQEELINYAQGSVLMGQRKVQRAVTNEKKFTTLSDRYRSLEQELKNKSDQKACDAFASRAFETLQSQS